MRPVSKMAVIRGMVMMKDGDHSGSRSRMSGFSHQDSALARPVLLDDLGKFIYLAFPGFQIRTFAYAC